MKEIPISVQIKVFGPEEFFDYVQENGATRAYRLFHTSLEKAETPEFIKSIEKTLSGLDFPTTYRPSAVRKGQKVLTWEYYPVTYVATREQFTQEMKPSDRDSLRSALGCVFVLPPKFKN